MTFEYIGLRCLRGSDCDTDHYLVFEKVRERLSVGKQATQTFDVEIFNRSKLSALEVREKYQSKISNTCAALENLNDGVDIKGIEKIRRLRPSLNPRTWVPETSMLTTRPPKPLYMEVNDG
jgi:hypothetical protein